MSLHAPESWKNVVTAKKKKPIGFNMHIITSAGKAWDAFQKSVSNKQLSF